MIALTRDFHIIAARITARFSAVFFSVCYVAQARYVRALFHLFVSHYGSFLCRYLLSDSIARLDVARSLYQPERLRVHSLARPR
jgi:hypothetical protein